MRAQPCVAGQGLSEPTALPTTHCHSHPESHGHPSGAPLGGSHAPSRHAPGLQTGPVRVPTPQPSGAGATVTPNAKAAWESPQTPLVPPRDDSNLGPEGRRRSQARCPPGLRAAEGVGRGRHPPALTAPRPQRRRVRGDPRAQARLPRLRRGAPALLRPESTPRSCPPHPLAHRRTRGTEILTSGSLLIITEPCAEAFKNPTGSETRFHPAPCGVSQ